MADIVKEHIASVDGWLQGIPFEKKKEMQDGNIMMVRDSFLPFLMEVFQGASNGIPLLGLGTIGCALIAWALDARDKSVAQSILRDLGIKQCKTIQMNGLKGSDADSLLMQQVLRKFGDLEEEQGESSAMSDDDDPELKSVKEEVLSFCNGLPLALKEVGASIANNNPENPMSKEAWEEAVVALRSTRGSDDSYVDLEKKLYKPLEYSITCLNDSLRKGLFDVVHMMDVDLMNVEWEMVESMIGEKELRNLMDRHLLEKCQKTLLITDRDVVEVKCHDVVRAVIKQMARKRYKEENLSIEFDDEIAQSRLANTGELGSVVSLHGSVSVDADFLLGDSDVDLPILLMASINMVFVPKVLPKVRVSELSEMIGLRCLSNVEIITNGECEDSSAIAGAAAAVVLPNLRFVQNVRGLKHIDFQASENFKVFIHNICSPLDHTDLGALLRTSSIRYLYLWQYSTTTSDYEKRKSLAAKIFEMVEISGYKDLRHLYLKSCSTPLPPSFGRNVPRLRSLHLTGQLEQLIQEEEYSSCLQYLTQLTTLELLSCQELQRLPQDISHLSALQKLRLVYCKRLESVPESICHFKRLKELHLNRCKKLRTLPEGMFTQPMTMSLEKLILRGCINLESLPQSISKLTNLKVLDLEGCWRLRTLPEGMFTQPMMKSLEELNLQNCNNLESLPQSISELTNLKVLNLVGCWDV